MMINYSTTTIFTFIVFSVLSSVSSSEEIIFAGDSDISRWKKTDEIYENSVNVGEGGSTCRQWVKRIGRNVDKVSPTTAVLVCGENDLVDRNSGQVFKDFRKVVEQIHAKGVDRIIYMGTKPEPDTKDLHRDYREYDGLIRNYYFDGEDKPDGRFTMVDVYPSFVAMDNPRSLYANDDLHLSKEGYNYWNTWLQLALADNSCIRWQDGNCAVRTDNGGGGGGDSAGGVDPGSEGENNDDDDDDDNDDNDDNDDDDDDDDASRCSDDPNFRYKGRGKLTCDWVGNNPNQRCDKKYRGSKLSEYCPSSCADC